MTNRPTKAKAIERIQKALDAIPALQQIRYDSPVFIKWRRDTLVALTYTFGETSTQPKSFARIRFRASALPMIVDRQVQQPFIDELEQSSYMEGLISASALLSSMLDEIKEYWEDDDQNSDSLVDREVVPTSTREVFVVHGKDIGTRDTVARFLEKELGLIPIILDEQANRGRTIIQKFQQYSQVGFAVVLLTPDDVGSLRGKESELRPRARQNVILELGYFISHLGLDRVCALTTGGVEIPSNYAGVLYIELEGNWKYALRKELKAAGLDIDANQAF